MFTLNFPIRLPDENSFFDNGQYPVPLLPGDLSLKCVSHDNSPLLLQVSGFTTEQDAIEFCPILRISLRVSALESGHSMTPSGAEPIISGERKFNGSVPTVTPTEKKALPYFITASVQKSLHVSVLSNWIGASLAQGIPTRVNARPELAVALELYSDCQFAGEQNAQFIVLMTALEILVPKTPSKGKRGAVIALVKSILAKAEHPDPKSVGKTLDALYATRNALLHEAKAVKDGDLQSLKEIVRSTLKVLIT